MAQCGEPCFSSNGIIRAPVECDSEEEVTGSTGEDVCLQALTPLLKKVHGLVSWAEDDKVSGNRTRCQKQGCALNKEERKGFCVLLQRCVLEEDCS